MFHAKYLTVLGSVDSKDIFEILRLKKAAVTRIISRLSVQWCYPIIAKKCCNFSLTLTFDLDLDLATMA